MELCHAVSRMISKNANMPTLVWFWKTRVLDCVACKHTNVSSIVSTGTHMWYVKTHTHPTSRVG